MSRELRSDDRVKRAAGPSSFLAIVACGVLVVSLLAGCGNASSDNSQAEEQSNEISATAETEETKAADSSSADDEDGLSSGETPYQEADSEESIDSDAESDDELSTIAGFNGSGDASEAVVVDGTVGVREENDDDGVAYTVYVLHRDERTRFAMGYAAAGAHERSAVADEVVLIREASDQSDYADLLWHDCVGQTLSVKGVLSVRDDQVELLGAIPADMSRLARQIGVQPRLWGIAGLVDYNKQGYTWRELERIAEVIAMSGDYRSSLMILDAYGIAIDDDDAKPIMLTDGSVYSMQLTDILVPVGESETGEDAYAGMEFKETDNPDGMTITLGGAGLGLPPMAE